MEQLPYIDQYARQIDASPEEVWRALLATVRRISPSLPGWLAAAWGLQHLSVAGQWDANVSVGSTVPGFAAAEVELSQLLALRGIHRFSDYELRFEIQPVADGRTRLSATTFAAFPGAKGRVYHALVIGSGGHRIAVRRILANVTRRATGHDR